MKNLLKSTMTALAVVVLLVIMALLPGRSQEVVPVQASGLNGLNGSSVYPPLITGTLRYTTSVVTSPAVRIDSWGEVQIMVKNVVTGSQTITITPQFSLQDVACESVSQWFSATTYLPYQGYSIVSSATTVTESVGSWQTAPVLDQFSLSGSGVVGREVKVQGQCMRVQLQFSNAGQSYTPTLTIRALNRN